MMEKLFSVTVAVILTAAFKFRNAADAVTFNEYINRCKHLSLYETGVSAEYGDKLITLSTGEYTRRGIGLWL